LGARLDDPLKPGPMGLWRSPADRVDDGIYLKTLFQGIESRKGEAHFSP
jgi:hypothetical protein